MKPLEAADVRANESPWKYRRILPALAAFVAMIIVGLLQFDQIVASIFVLLGRASLERIVAAPLPRGLWTLALVNFLIVAIFLFLLPVKIEAPWRAHGAYLGFAISLFSEMYGLPLTVYFLSGAGFAYFEPQFVGYVFVYGQLIGSPIVIAGLILIYKGWKEIYFQRDALVTQGIYTAVRHPQYLGLMLVTLGHLLTWPTIPTAILWPVLTVLYYRQARREEAALSAKFADQFGEYARKTPMFFPRIPLRRKTKPMSP
ncbi:MAG: isoprenylcysteine carboxylmethyltransferase family protein [Chloroflexi bacterium]|nr:isoprenylcysteine carboxylmethyltransferase family protein [Chloroflexota bacterium]